MESGPQHRARQQLRAAEQLSRAVVEMLEEGVVVTDADLRPVSWNASVLSILGATAAELLEYGALGDPATLRNADGSALTAAETPVGRASRDRAPAQATLRRHRAEGERWITVLARPISGGHAGHRAGLVCTIADVTGPVEAELRLREERDRAQRYLEVASTLVVVLTASGIVELINRQGCETLGLTEAEIVGSDWFDAVIPPGDRLAARRSFMQLVAGVVEPGESLETFVQTRTGEARKIAWRNAVLRDAEGTVTSLLRSGEDVTERRRAEAEVAHLAYHDRLTGLPNRTRLEEHLARDLARARRSGGSLALLFFDLDNFKLVNDSLGHATGDAVLREAAQRVTALTRTGDILARLGGDEFLALVECPAGEAPQEVARAAGERILAELDEPFEISGATFHVGASVGIALFPDHGTDAETLLKHADAAMYQAKRGDGHLAFYESDGADKRQRLSLTARLRRAVGQGELRLHYQPIWSIGPPGAQVCRLESLEALVRWEDPEHGLIPPGDFIPVAEESGVIDAIGDWVVDELCLQAGRWAEQGFTPMLAFNLSAKQLRLPDLAASIAARIAAAGLEATQFCAELTETAVMSDAQRHRSLLTELGEAGLTIAIDDFGSGHSSLSRLRDLPVGVLKIDRSFLARVPADPQSNAVVSAMLALGRALGLQIVVEGVETPEQLAFLRENGSPLVQGFLLGRPVPPEQVPVPADAAA